jgi:hypothetical protein
MIRHILPALIASLLATGPALAAGDPSDPNWPCVQRKVPQLSLGQVWAGPLPDAATEALAHSREVEALAALLELRKLTEEEQRALVERFVEGGGDRAQRLTALYLATFERINRHRAALVDGIGRFALKQKELSAQIEERRHEIARLSAADPVDFDAIDAEEERLDWDTRIFTDRKQSLTYVCETPVILEQHAFALGRLVGGYLP